MEVIPPDGKDVQAPDLQVRQRRRRCTWAAPGATARWPSRARWARCRTAAGPRTAPPEINIPNYKGHGGIFGDFLHCVKTRQRPFRDIEIAHRTVATCHLANIAFWLGPAVQVRPGQGGDRRRRRGQPLDRPAETGPVDLCERSVRSTIAEQTMWTQNAQKPFHSSHSRKGYTHETLPDRIVGGRDPSGKRRAAGGRGSRTSASSPSSSPARSRPPRGRRSNWRRSTPRCSTP